MQQSKELTYSGTDITNTFSALDHKYTALVKKATWVFSNTDMEREYTESEYALEKAKLTLKENRVNIIIGLIYGLLAVHILFTFCTCIKSIHELTAYRIHDNLTIWMLCIAVSLITWLYSTRQDYYNFYNRKTLTFSLIVIHACSFLLPLLLKIEYQILIPLMAKVPISMFITQEMIVNLSRLLLFILSFIPTVALTILAVEFLQREDVKETILDYRIEDSIDFRNDAEYKYDMNVVKNLETAKPYTIKEQDRYLHMALNGTTGTGKTSSIMTVAIADDFDQILKNKQYQKKELMKLLEENLAYVTKPFDDISFNAKYIVPMEKAKKRYKKILDTAPIAGLTTMAPNEQFADEIYRLAKQRHLKVNRIDPILTETGAHKEDFIGFNPMYISPNLSPLFRNLEITKKARVTADVLQVLFEMNGKGDPYFTSLNRNVTTCLVILILLTYDSLHKRRPNDIRFKNPLPTLEILQDILYNFDHAQDFIAEYEYLTSHYSKKELGFNKKNYQFVIDLVNNDLLGAGRDAMYDQARGLRTIIDGFLANPLIKDVICCQNSIDMDKMLLEGEITVVNYALELGRADAVVFALFFMLSLNNAVLRRPGDNRNPYFVYIDELPVMLHSSLEECFTLFRQYRVPMCVALQTFEQMNKSETTKYLRGILQGNCATQFVFGRISRTEMQEYELLGGKQKEYVEQKTISETSLSMENTSLSYSTRITPQETATVSGSKMRNLKFQEVTVFTVNQGSPVPPFYGKVSFIKKHKLLRRVQKKIDWNRYYKDETIMMNGGAAADSLGDKSTAQTIPQNSTTISVNTDTRNSQKIRFSSGRTNVTVNLNHMPPVEEASDKKSTISDIPEPLDAPASTEHVVPDETAEIPDNDIIYIFDGD